MTTKTVKKLITIILSIVLITLIYPKVNATQLTNTSDQYMELKVVSVKNVDNADKQVILEWWSHNLKFKGLDLRFSYDDTKLKPSSVSDNSYVTDNSSFEFENDFGSYMDYFVLNSDNGTYRCVMSLENYDTTHANIENDSSLGYVVNTNVDGGVLLGKMSFRLYNGEVDENTFKLKTDTKSPTTGIKIAQTSDSAYEDQSVFKFKAFSDDAKLSDIKYSFFNYEENKTTKPENLTYTNLDMSTTESTSTDSISKYKINYTDKLENISLSLTKSNENATVKINNEEMDVSNTKELALNPLGQGDTTIEILVTAQDKTTTHTYEITIHRPFATIKGTLKYDKIEENENPDIDKTTMLNIYKTGDFDWYKLQDIFAEDALTYDDLDQIAKVSEEKSKSDGSYEIYITPGTYDLQIDKRGFLDYIISNIVLSENDVVDLGEKTLIAGDVDRDAIVGVKDMQDLLGNMDIEKDDSLYKEQYDLIQEGVVGVKSLQYIATNTDKQITIEKR